MKFYSNWLTSFIIFRREIGILWFGRLDGLSGIESELIRNCQVVLIGVIYSTYLLIMRCSQMLGDACPAVPNLHPPHSFLSIKPHPPTPLSLSLSLDLIFNLDPIYMFNSSSLCYFNHHRNHGNLLHFWYPTLYYFFLCPNSNLFRAPSVVFPSMAPAPPQRQTPPSWFHGLALHWRDTRALLSKPKFLLLH